MKLDIVSKVVKLVRSRRTGSPTWKRYPISALYRKGGEMKNCVSVALTVFAMGCDGATEPTVSSVAGAYEAVEFTITTAGDVVDQLAGGARFEITLAENGTTSGTLFVPEGGEGGGDFQADLSGSWALEGDTVTFDQTADTFVRDMPFRYQDGRLVGDQTFGGTRVQAVLAVSH